MIATASSRDRRSQMGGEYFDQTIKGDFRNGLAQRARFENCCFLDSPFSKSSYLGCTFVNCDFVEAQMSLCDFTASTITGCKFLDCDLDQSVFHSAIIEETRFVGGRAQYSSFLMATLKTVLLNLDLHGADLRFRAAEGIDYGDSNLWAAAVNINCNTFSDKVLSERQIKVLLALIACSKGNDDLRESVRKLAGDHYNGMMEKIMNKVR